MKKTKYNCNRCKEFDTNNGYFCRICGHSVQFDDKARSKINIAHTTDEKYCDYCGKAWHNGTSCSSVKKLKY